MKKHTNLIFKFSEFNSHMDICDKIGKFAFTLAEVLITLGIIGVVAALTLPPLIQHHNKVVWVNQLKKSISTLENGFKLMLADEGVDKLTDTSIWPNEDCSVYANCPEFFDNLKKYFNINFDNNFIKSVNNRSVQGYENIPFEIIFLNGMQMNFTVRAKDKLDVGSKLYQSNMTIINSYSAMVIILVDVNGNKKPNRMGRDIFVLSLTNEGNILPYGGIAFLKAECKYNGSTILYPYTWENSVPHACFNMYAPDAGCAARIIEEGWKMNY